MKNNITLEYRIWSYRKNRNLIVNRNLDDIYFSGFKPLDFLQLYLINDSFKNFIDDVMEEVKDLEVDRSYVEVCDGNNLKIINPNSSDEFDNDIIISQDGGDFTLTPFLLGRLWGQGFNSGIIDENDKIILNKVYKDSTIIEVNPKAPFRMLLQFEKEYHNLGK